MSANPYMCSQPTKYSQYDENLLIPAIPATTESPAATSNMVALSAPVSNTLDLGLHKHTHWSHAQHLFGKHSAGGGGEGNMSIEEYKEMPPPLGIFDEIMAKAVKDAMAKWKYKHINLVKLIDKVNKDTSHESMEAYVQFIKKGDSCKPFTYMLNKTWQDGKPVTNLHYRPHVKVNEVKAELLNSICDVIHLRGVFEIHEDDEKLKKNKIEIPAEIDPTMQAYLRNREAHASNRNAVANNMEDRAANPTPDEVQGFKEARYVEDVHNQRVIAEEVASVYGKHYDHRPPRPSSSGAGEAASGANDAAQQGDLNGPVVEGAGAGSLQEAPPVQREDSAISSQYV